jgi:hypothetical protein
MGNTLQIRIRSRNNEIRTRNGTIQKMQITTTPFFLFNELDTTNHLNQVHTIVQMVEMANIPPARTFPIAIGLGGIALIITALTLYETSSHPNDLLTALVLVIGLCLALAAIPVYDQERKRWYADREADRQAIHV